VGGGCLMIMRMMMRIISRVTSQVGSTKRDLGPGEMRVRLSEDWGGES
jgi:hypothetical protein